MLKVGDKVKFKYGYDLAHYGDHGEIVTVDNQLFEIKINSIPDFLIYRPRNELSKIITIFAGIF